MKDLFDKISSYNIFNYLLPGVLFCVISQQFVGYDFIQKDPLLGGFIYYFVGMVISRFGSIVIEPFLKKVNYIKYSEYKKFITGSKIDEKIELLSEINNTYRTIVSLILLLFIVKLYEIVDVRLTLPIELTAGVTGALLLIMFLSAYRKQTDYLAKRIDKATEGI